MSAVELLAQLGASAELQREDSEKGKEVRKLARAAVEEIESSIDQWCGVVPAEDEDDNQDKEDDEDSETSINLH